MVASPVCPLVCRTSRPEPALWSQRAAQSGAATPASQALPDPHSPSQGLGAHASATALPTHLLSLVLSSLSLHLIFCIINSDDHYIYYCGQESLRRNGVAIMINKRVRNAVLGCNLKNDRMTSVRFQTKPFNITVIQVYTPTSNAEETEVEWFYEDLQDLLELTPKKDLLLIIGDWNAKVGSQETPGVTGKFGLGKWNEAGQRLIEFCQENALVITNTLFQQHKRRLYTWTSTHGQHRNQTDYILCSQRWRSSIQSAKTRPGADCGSDHEFLIAKFRLKLKKGGKTTRPFRYDLNQIPYDYTVEVRNRFKGLDLIECRMNYGMRFVTLDRRQGSRPSPWKRNAKKQNGCLGRPYK